MCRAVMADLLSVAVRLMLVLAPRGQVMTGSHREQLVAGHSGKLAAPEFTAVYLSLWDMDRKCNGTEGTGFDSAGSPLKVDEFI